jgi:hypothetical protein
LEATAGIQGIVRCLQQRFHACDAKFPESSNIITKHRIQDDRAKCKSLISSTWI